MFWDEKKYISKEMFESHVDNILIGQQCKYFYTYSGCLLNSKKFQ